MFVSRWMKRLFNAAAAVSALMLLFVLAVWVRGYYATDAIRFQPRIDYVLHAYAVAWGRGYVALGIEQAQGGDVSVVRLESMPARRLDGAWATGVR